MAMRNVQGAVQKLLNKQVPLPQIINRQSLLQANSQKLSTRLSQILFANIFFEGVDVEKDDHEIKDGVDENLEPSELEFLTDLYSKSMDNAGDKMHADGAVLPDIPEDRNAALSVEETIIEELKMQLNSLPLTKEQLQVGEFLIESMNSQGFLEDPDEHIEYLFRDSGIPKETSEQTLRLLKTTLEPRGILSRGVQESLLIQADELPDTVAKFTLVRIIRDRFQDLLNRDFDALRRSFHLNNYDLLDETQILFRKLNPVPIPVVEGAISQREKHDVDLVVTKENGRYRAILTDKSNPSIRISAHYMKTLATLQKQKEKGIKVDEVFDYLRNDWNMIEDARKWLVERREALEGVVSYVLNQQAQFLKDFDSDSLEPLLIKDIAPVFNLSPSTLSRIASEKVIQTDTGRVINLKMLFTQGFRTEAGHRASVSEIKDQVKEILKNEDRNHPKTYIELEQDLRTLGYVVGASTVRKLCDNWGIAESKIRRMQYLNQTNEHSSTHNLAFGGDASIDQNLPRKGIRM